MPHHRLPVGIRRRRPHPSSARRLSAAAFLLSLGLLPLASCAQNGQVQVAHVVDGDTLILVDGRKVRIAGIDTPELKPVPEPGGLEARRALKRLIGRRAVTLEEVPPGVDKYGRTLARVWTAEGEDAGAALIREGLAEVYTRGHPPLILEYYALEREARIERRGIWADVPVLTPGRIGGSRGDLVIVEGRIAEVRTPGGHRFLDFHAGGREIFTAAVFREDLAAFPDDPVSWEGRRVQVAGRLRKGPRGHMEMVVPHPSRVLLLPESR